VNMLAGYARHDHRAFPERQRRLDSGSLSPRQERTGRGTWQHLLHAVIRGPHYADVQKCHDVLS